MTIHIQMLQDIASHAHAMANAMQAIVDDCAEQLARRKAAGESEESIMNEPFQKETKQSDGFTPYDGPTPFDEKTTDTLKLTIVELRAFVAARSTPENRPKIKEILTRYGVKKLTELSENQYEAVKNEVAAL